MTGIKEVQRSPVLECILAMDIDSTMELPSEPDPGFAGSSSCVHNTWEHMGVCSALGELQLQCSSRVVRSGALGKHKTKAKTLFQSRATRSHAPHRSHSLTRSFFSPDLSLCTSIAR